MDQKREFFLKAWVPRGLVCLAENIEEPRVTSEGLCPLKIGWEAGRISSIGLIDDLEAFPSNLLLPRLLEPHAHLDKAFTWRKFPNLLGRYNNALELNLKEFQTRTFSSVRERAKNALFLALRHGVRALRSHVDSIGPSSEASWEVLLDLRKEWKSFIDLQLVALVPLEYWSTRQGEILAARVASCGGLFGGVFAPPFNGNNDNSRLIKLLKLANKFGCAIDLHIDESQINPAAGLQQLIHALKQLKITVPITCSHSSSMGLLPSNRLRRLAEQLEIYGVNVIALPLTNAWLLGRNARATSCKRPLAPIQQLQQAGVTVAVGGDNVQDPWFPIGNFDPIALMAYALPIAQLAPWQRLGLAPFTTSAAYLMGLDWDGTIKLGSPADLLVLEADSWVGALAAPPSRKVLVAGRWLDDTSISHQNFNNFWTNE